MSVEAITWASKQTVGSPGAKLVLIALANYANDKHECWPSQATLAQWTEQSDRTIRTHLVALESMGLIHRQSREVAGTFTSDIITLRLDQRQIFPPEKSSVGEKQQFPTEKFSTYPSKEPLIKKEIRARGNQIPESFKPNPTHAQLANELGLDLDREMSAFTDFHRSKASTFKDWDAALRTWLRKAHQFRQPKPGAHTGAAHPSKAQQQQRDKEWLDELTGNKPANTVIDITPR